MKVNEFVDAYKAQRFMNTKAGSEEKFEYLKRELKVKTYIPFREKRAVVEAVVAQNIKIVDGMKKYDSINAYLSFVVAMLSTHTCLEWSEDPVADYDMLSENELLMPIIDTFRTSYDEHDILLKLALASELEDNSVNALVGRFLNDLSDKLDGVSEMLKGMIGDINVEKILGNFNQDDLAKLKGLLNK